MPELRPYQIEDIEFLSKLKCSGCFNEQRTGKTPTALKVLRKQMRRKILIIAPASALYQWAEQFEVWLNRPCIVLDGTPKKKEKLLEDWTYGLVISYDSFKKTQRSNGMIDKILAKNPEAIILDEAHRIKDTKSAAAQAAFATKHIEYRIALTGTPAHGKQEEIFSILHWLYPKTFSSYWQFIGHYFKQVKITLTDGRSFKKTGKFKPGREHELQTFLSKISTQRKRVEVMPWLPEKDYEKIKLPPTDLQKKYLDELNNYFETEHIITQGVLDRLIRYRQICLHPALLNLKGSSPKLDWIKQYIQDYPDKPIVIFSKFTSFIKILAEELKTLKIGVIIGETPIKTRNNLKHQFQNGELNVLIINIDAGKEALTLDRAEAAIFTDKFPPVGDILQAEDRITATTEDRASKPHQIIELMLKGTYDEQLYKLLDIRASEVDVLNDYKKYLERRS